MSLAVLLISLLVFPLAGYGLAARLRSHGPGERLAVAVLAGFATILATVALVNAFAPLSGWRSWLCLWPVLFTLGDRVAREALARDSVAILRSFKGRLAALLGLGALALLSWPELARPELVYYDGTSNHDGYFWIAGAKYLQSHDYLATAEPIDLAHPWANVTAGTRTAITGWQPSWGRAGAEGLLALTASLATRDPVEIYLSLTAALLLPWIAAVYLLVRTFWIHALHVPGVIALVALQPLFFFYRANGNLPNLLGALAGAALVVATQRSLAAPTPSAPWLALLVLSQHAVLYAYPEIFPFVALPCALLLARTLRSSPRAVAPVFVAALLGLAFNPATTARAVHGFVHSFTSARHDVDWVDTFSGLGLTQYLPSLVTMSLPAAKFAGSIVSAVATALLLAAAWLAVRRAPDRFGALASLSGGALLLGYTIAADFSYGWQKAAQFSGAALAALLPVAVVNGNGRPRLSRALAVLVGGIFVVAMVFHALEAAKWSRRKDLSRDWFALASFVRTHLPERAVTIEPATFSMAFFHGMWAAYFLPDNPLSFAIRGEKNGGYLHPHIRTEAPDTAIEPCPMLLSRAWADAFDPDSPRLFSSGTVVLAEKATRVDALHGFSPMHGLPNAASGILALDLRPPSAALLHVTLSAAAPDAAAPVQWQLRREAHGSPPFTAELHSADPWNFVVPLAGDRSNHIELIATPEPRQDSFPYRVTTLRIADAP